MHTHIIELKFSAAKFFELERPQITDLDSAPKKTKTLLHPNNFKVNPNTLWHSHVCNALHVIMGYRPVPTLRKLTRPLEYGWIPELVEIAKNAQVRLDSPVERETSTGKTINETEIFAGVKYFGTKNSGPYDKGSKKPIILGGETHFLETCTLDWDRIRYYMGDSWVDFEKIILEVFGEYSNSTVYVVLGKLHDYYQEYINNLTNLHLFFIKYFLNVPKNGYKIGKPIYEIIVNGNTKGQFFNMSGYGNMGASFIKLVLHSPEQVTTLSGTIYLKVTYNEITRLREFGRSTASLLEGGVLSISAIEDIDTYNWSLNTINTTQVQTER